MYVCYSRLLMLWNSNMEPHNKKQANPIPYTQQCMERQHKKTPGKMDAKKSSRDDVALIDERTARTIASNCYNIPRHATLHNPCLVWV